VVGIDQQRKPVRWRGRRRVAHALFNHRQQGALHARRGIGDVGENLRRVGDALAQIERSIWSGLRSEAMSK
jgi:hypothetical protein